MSTKVSNLPILLISVMFLQNTIILFACVFSYGCHAVSDVEHTAAAARAQATIALVSERGKNTGGPRQQYQRHGLIRASSLLITHFLLLITHHIAHHSLLITHY
jgi:hypothetical protein